MTAPNPRGTRNHLCEALNGGLASGDSGLQLNLEIALSGVSAKVKPFNQFQAGRKCVEASDDVIKNILLPVPTTANRTKVPYTALGRAGKNVLDYVNFCQEVHDMRLRIRTILCCTAIFSVVSFFTITFAETESISQGSGRRRIRKVKDGVDEFGSIRPARETARIGRIGEEQRSSKARPGCKPANKDARKDQAKDQGKQTKDDLPNAMDDLNRTTNRLRRKSMKRRISGDQRQMDGSWTARAA